MSVKILTVDDSKAVRIIVKKAFKQFDCQIVEAANGVEGLSMAAQEEPDIILLDVTMPVMDGVEMLTKLKADPDLKKIPVIMLTAEAGRQAVMKIAKLGIRDYVVKPFKEDVLVDKVGRVIELRPTASGEPQVRKLTDAVNILVVDDKPAIVEQIRDGLSHMPWKVHGAASTGEAIDFGQKTTPDLIVLSLALPEKAAYSIFRMLRADAKTKFTPIFALAVKTEAEAQQQAQVMGFTNIITKPINFGDMEGRIAKAINLDTSERYFKFEEDTLVVQLPETVNSNTLAEIEGYARDKVSEAVDKGFYRIVCDMSVLGAMDVETVKTLVKIKEICAELTLTLSLVAPESITEECKQFEEANSWQFFTSLEEAKAAPLAA